MKSLLRLIIGMFCMVLGADSFAAAPPCLPPDCTAFPPDAGFLNVRDFGAKGDGVADDTAAINAALTASGGDTGPAFWQDRIVYFPNGTYIVSAPIVKRYAEGRFGSGAILIGQAKDTTVIRLKDKSPGYDDPARPKAIIFTSAKLLDGNATGGGKDYTNKGEGNDAFMNFVENMTVDAGAGNPGAIGIDYLANNVGAIRNVMVRGDGVTGISLTRKWPGPALLQNVTVQGFATGIDVANTEYGVTMESIRLEGQQIGLRNDHNVIAIHDLTITDAKLPISNLSHDGLIVITGGTISQAASAGEAIHNAGSLNLRALKITDYETALGAPLPDFLEGVYKENTRVGAAITSWSLPVKNPPLAPADAPEKWVSVGAYGAQPDAKDDATESIRKAFASGARTIYFPHGIYLISDNIIVPASVQRIVGMTSTIRAHASRQESFRRELGMFRTVDHPESLLIEKLAFDNSYLGDQVAVEAAGAGPVVLRDVTGAGVTTLLRAKNGGEAFLENTCCGVISVTGSNGVWARQLNTEGPGVRIRNDGTPLWVLGFKTEQNCTVLENTNGAKTVLLGGLIYMVHTSKMPLPAFINRDSQLLLSYVEEAFQPESVYAVHLVDTQKGEGKITYADALPKRTIGRIVPQLTSR